MTDASTVADRSGLRERHPQIFTPPARHRYWAIGLVAAILGLLAFGMWRLEFSLERMLGGLGQLGQIIGLMMPPVPDTMSKAVLYLVSLGETIAIAYLGTLLAAILAFPMGFLAARNATINTLVHFLSRRFLDSIRGVDTLIWALIWVNVVGLGPFAGVLAIMSSDFGSFGKLFSEAIEAADNKPVEGVIASGGSRLHGIRFGLLPQVLPVILSQMLYYFESNTRSATIIGIVGAGGIGLHLSEQIRTLEWRDVGFIILIILIAVAIIDQISSRLRRAIIGERRLTH